MIFSDYDETIMLREDSEGRVYRNEELVAKLLTCHKYGLVIWSTRDTHELRALVHQHFPELEAIATAILQKPMLCIDDHPEILLPLSRIYTPQAFLNLKNL